MVARGRDSWNISGELQHFRRQQINKYRLVVDYDQITRWKIRASLNATNIQSDVQINVHSYLSKGVDDLLRKLLPTDFHHPAFLFRKRDLGIGSERRADMSAILPGGGLLSTPSLQFSDFLCYYLENLRQIQFLQGFYLARRT